MPPDKALFISTPSPALAKAHVVQMSIMFPAPGTANYDTRSTAPGRLQAGAARVMTKATRGRSVPESSVLQLLLH